MDARSAALAFIGLRLIRKRKERLKKKRLWIRNWILRRNSRGSYGQLFQELLLSESPKDSLNFLRIPSPVFHFLLEKVSPLISKEDTLMRSSICAGERLQATLLFLGTGASYARLEYLTRISRPSLSKIIPETCAALYTALKDEYLKIPTSSEEWLLVAQEFGLRWNFPNCVGAIDGKHILIKPPPGRGSLYFNYKHTFSIVLMAVANANYEVIYADVGSNSTISDGGAWRDCTLNQALQSQEIALPPDSQLPNSDILVPHVFIADDAFPLKPWLMKPFPHQSQSISQHIFSYRLSRARRVVENTLGIMANKFKVLQTTIPLDPAKVEKVVMAVIVLHNYLRREYSNDHTPSGSLDSEDTTAGLVNQGSWRQEGSLTELEPLKGGRVSNEAENVREKFKNYFCGVGAVPWQHKMVGM